MKKVLLFVLFLVFAIFIFNKFYIAGFTTLKIDGKVEAGGKNIIIKQISAASVVVEVNGVSDIVKLNDDKEINGVRVTIHEIFYVAEKEGRYVKLSLESLYMCGDGTCEADETKENCCKDCGCISGYICENNKCIIKSTSSKLDECKDDDDCDDDNDFTIDRCKGSPKKCIYTEYYQCTSNEDCDDNNECTKDVCKNHECFNTKISGCKSKVKTEKPTKTDSITISFDDEETALEEEAGFLSKLFSILFGWLG